MTIFTKTATTPAGPEGGYPLPDGYDDSSGPTYVPDRYRDAWARHAGADGIIPGNLTPFCRAIAEYRALKAARPDEFEPRRGPFSTFVTDPATGNTQGYPTVIPPKAPHLLTQAVEMGRSDGHLLFALGQNGQQATEKIMQTEWGSLASEAEHALRLHHVVVQFEREEFLKSEAFKLEQRNMCPVCGVSSIETGEPAPRNIVPVGLSGYGRRITIVSCAGCYLAAVEYLTGELAHSAVGEYPPKTRLQHVRDHFEKEGF